MFYRHDGRSAKSYTQTSNVLWMFSWLFLTVTKMFAIPRTYSYLTADWLKSFKTRNASRGFSEIILRKNKYGCALELTIFIKFGMSLCEILLAYNFLLVYCFSKCSSIESFRIFYVLQIMSSTDEAKEKEKSIFFWRNWGRKCDRVRKELYECVIVTDCCQKVGMHFEDKHADNFFIFRRYHSYMIMSHDGYSAVCLQR